MREEIADKDDELDCLQQQYIEENAESINEMQREQEAALAAVEAEKAELAEAVAERDA